MTTPTPPRRAVTPLRCAALGAVAAAWPFLALAVCIEEPPAVDAEFQSSAAVVVGPVVAERVVLSSNPDEDGSFFTVRIEEVLRGSPPGKTLTFFKKNERGRFVVIKGRTHIFFVRSAPGLLDVDGCGNSGPLPEREDVLSAARRLYVPRRGSR